MSRVGAGPRKPTRKPTRKPSRAERARENRARLIHAALEVVGEHGYAEASVARIVARAGLAQGTFYLYFASRQDLFDQLLPEVGDEALATIREAVRGVEGFVAQEGRAMRAFFEYVVRNPAYLRVFTEAEVAAPAAYHAYTRKRTGSFLAVLAAALKRGEITGYSVRELGVLTQILLAARAYLFQEYGKSPRGTRLPPDWVVDTYVKFLRHGLGGDASRAAARPVTPRQTRPLASPRRAARR